MISNADTILFFYQPVYSELPYSILSSLLAQKYMYQLYLIVFMVLFSTCHYHI